MDLLPESIEFSCSRQRNRVSIVRHFIVSTWPRCVINRRNQAGTRRWRAWVRERVRVDIGQTGKGRTKRTRRTRVSFWREKERARGEEERGVALRLVHARTPTSGTHVTRPDRYALPKLRSLFLSLSLSFSLSLSLSLSLIPLPSTVPSSSPVFVAFLFATLFSFAFSVPCLQLFRVLPPSRVFFVPSHVLSPPPRSRVTDRSYTDDNCPLHGFRHERLSFRQTTLA